MPLTWKKLHFRLITAALKRSLHPPASQIDVQHIQHGAGLAVGYWVAVLPHRTLTLSQAQQQLPALLTKAVQGLPWECPVLLSHLGEQQRREWRTRGNAKPWRKFGFCAYAGEESWLRPTSSGNVASSSLILWQQRYDLPALPATNSMPELIGGIRRPPTSSVINS